MTEWEILPALHFWHFLFSQRERWKWFCLPILGGQKNIVCLRVTNYPSVESTLQGSWHHSSHFSLNTMQITQKRFSLAPWNYTALKIDLMTKSPHHVQFNRLSIYRRNGGKYHHTHTTHTPHTHTHHTHQTHPAHTPLTHPTHTPHTHTHPILTQV